MGAAGALGLWALGGAGAAAWGWAGLPGARGALGEPKTSPARKRPWWEHAAEVGGAAGLGGLVAFAVGAALDEKRRGKKKP